MQSIAGPGPGPGPGYYINLARKVAREARELGRGRGVGCVVVDPTGSSSSSSSSSGPVIVAVAGDARYAYPCPEPQEAEKETSPKRRRRREQEKRGPESHATMRAIEMVASQLRAAAATTEHEPSSTGKPPTLTPPLTPLESTYYNTSHRSGSGSGSAPDAASVPGYLCTNLDLYLTHEPCLSCSMGILLSRFRSVVFARKGRLPSGGLVSEEVPGSSSSSADKRETASHSDAETQQDGRNEEKSTGQDQRNYYGLHWRKELNWRALCFEFVEDHDPDIDDNDRDCERQHDDDDDDDDVFNA